MKNLSFILIVALALGIFISCKDEEIDLIAPLVTILEPTENQNVESNFELIYSIDEPNLDSALVYLGNTLLTSTEELASRLSLNTNGLSEGEYYLKLKAVDLSGNIGSDSIKINIDYPDTEAPIISKMLPENNEVFHDIINVEIAAEDNEGISKVQLYFNNSLQGELSVEPYDFIVDVKPFKNGTYELKAIATDIEGNTTEQTREVIVVTEPVLDKPIEFIASKGDHWNSISLTWQPVPQATSYEVYRIDLNTEEFSLVGTTTSTQYSDEFPEIENPLTDIFYKIRAFNSNVEFGGFSELDYGYYTGRSYDAILSFGKEGNNPGEFKFSEHVTVDNSGNFYISETVSSPSIQKFSPDGTFIEKYYICGTPRAFRFLPNSQALVACSSENKIKIIDSDKNLVREWGGSGSGNGMFMYFRQVAVDGDVLFIVDQVNNRIQKMNLNGDFITKWGTEGTADGQFKYPWGITLYKGMVVVSSDKRLQFFDKNGSFIKSWTFSNSLYDLAADNEHIYVAASNVVLKIDEERHFTDKIGEGDGGAVGITLKGNGDVVVMDTYKRELRVYRKNE